MRTDAQRSKKYAAKVRGLVLPGQIGRFTSIIGKQVEIEEIVKGIVGPDINRVYYMIYGKEVYKLMYAHSSGILDTEIYITRHKWIMRGLDAGKMNDIEFALGYQAGDVFTMDHSLLDGSDWLR